MTLRINDTAPDFTADTTDGPLTFHKWIGDGWAVLFSHPKDFTPICTTELGTMAGLKDEFTKRGVKILGISVDPVESHNKWKGDIQRATGHAVNYPLIGDPELKVAKLYDMLPASAGDKSEGRTPADNQTVRSVFVIGPDKKIKLTLTYPMATGRNFQEILRAIDSIQLTVKFPVSTPADWMPGEEVVIAGSVSDEDAAKRFGTFKTILPYLRKTKQPLA
ncbi:MAG TPA: peroxiredoxin [Acetobacteraceae bacterium]|nr:peroxiredoxin [Acetobacteraceae bacterium]